MPPRPGARARPVPTTLQPVPEPRRYPPGYTWAAGMVSVLYLGVLIFLGTGFFGLPNVDPVRAGGWYFAIVLMIITPAAVVVLLMTWALVAVLRRAGARTWPGVVQSLPAFAAVLGILYALTRWLFAGDGSE